MPRLDLLIRNCTVLTMDDAYTVLPNHDVSIQNRRIAAIAPTGASLEAVKVVEAKGLYLLPGLVNTHTHVGQAYFKGTTAAMELLKWLEWGWFYIQRMTQEDIYWSALLNVLEMIRSGVTTFADMYFYEDNVARAVEQGGLRACLGEAIMEGIPGMDPRMPVDDQIAYALDVHRRWHGAANDRIHIFLAPHSLYLCSAPTIEKVLAVADERDARIEIHLSETRSEVEQAYQTWGMTPPQRLEALGMLDYPLLAAHCVHLTDDDLKLLDTPQFAVSHNPASNLKLQSGRAPVEKMVGRHMSVGLGSDGCGSNDVIDILKEAYLAAILHPWSEEQDSARTSLAMAMREGARALGLHDEIGTVEVGKKADLILIELDQARTTPVYEPHAGIVFTARGDDVVTTIVDGQVLMEDHVVKSLDENEILAQARERAARIFSEPFATRFHQGIQPPRHQDLGII